MEETMSDLRYPIGQYQAASTTTPAERILCMRQIGELPNLLRLAVQGLADSQLDTVYRPEGWTVRQVVHHLADSHMNWYVRTKLGLTENEPIIKPFDEALWAELSDARTSPVLHSLALLDGLHGRWTQMFESLQPADWSRKLIHPERGLMTLDTLLPMMAWHGRHHTAHITELKKRMGW